MIRKRRRWLLYALVWFVCLALYVPFRLMAESYNTVLVPSPGGFAHPLASFLWPSYVLVVSFGVAFSGSRLRVPIIARLVAAVLIVGWIDVSAWVDDALMLTGDGRLGLDAVCGVFDTTYLSQQMCVVAFVFGLLLGEVGGIMVKRLARAQSSGTSEPSLRAPKDHHVD